MTSDKLMIVSTRYDRLWYVASPYTSTSEEEEHMRYAAVCDAADNLMSQGYLVYSPIAQTVPMAKYGRPESASKTLWDDWKEFDEAFIRKCDGILVLQLEGWKESVGVTAELHYALELNMDIMGVDPVSHKVGYIDLAHLFTE